MTGWKMAINSAIPCLVILFFGSWSDRHNRRKPCILVPLAGQIMMAFSLLLCVYFEKSPIEMAIFVEVFFPSITGKTIRHQLPLNWVFFKLQFLVFTHCRQSFHNDGRFLQLHRGHNHRKGTNRTYWHH